MMCVEGGGEEEGEKMRRENRRIRCQGSPPGGGCFFVGAKK